MRIVLQPFHNLRFKASAFVLSLLAACLIYSTSAQGPATSGVDSIRLDELREKLTYIASEKFKGRGNGTSELNMAAEYIAGVFEKNGLKPAGTAGRYFQAFDMYTSRLGSGNDLRFGGFRDSGSRLKVRTDFMPERWSLSGTVTAPVVFVDTIADPPDLKNKIAVVIEGDGPTDDPEFPENASAARTLQKAGAAGVIVAQDPSDRGGSRIIGLAENFRDDLPTRQTPMGTVDSPEYPTVPVVVLSSDLGRRLIVDLKDARNKIEATITVDVKRNIFRTQNVLGLVEGRDPSLKNQVMVVGAHYDHDGQANGQIWYGADDDGSGIAALLELAEAFGGGSTRPARSILLCAWAGEEKGLLGSRYYVSHPVFPLERTVAMFQMDMIGRNEEHSADGLQQIPEEYASDNANSVNVLGSAFSPDLKSTISRLNGETNLMVRFRYDFKAEDLLRRSDQWSFLAKRIPAVFFFTGLHPDYHTPRDTAAKINYPKLEKIAKLVYLSAFEIANNPTPPKYLQPTP